MGVPLVEVTPVAGEHPATGQADEVSPVRPDIGQHTMAVPEAGRRVLQVDLRTHAECG